MPQVFISYSRKDLPFIERLAKDLRAAGLEVWYDLSGLKPGERWGGEIQAAIRGSQYFLAVLSPNSVKSEWVEREAIYAGGQKIKLVPVLLRECEIPMWAINRHVIDLSAKQYDQNLPQLLTALGANDARGAEPPKGRAGWRRIAALGLPAIAVIALAVWGLSAAVRQDAPSPAATAVLTPAAGDQRTRARDGMTEVYVPVDGALNPDAFWIDQTEVTNAMYALCVADARCESPESFPSLTRAQYYGDPAFDDYPVIYVTLSMAQDYCAWVGGTLPSEQQWQVAAGAADGRTYPWGDAEPTCEIANYNNDVSDCVGDTSEVGSYPGGASPFGILDMGGNVWEWTGTPFDSTSYIMRGGSWGADEYWMRIAIANYQLPSGAHHSIGFRCIRSE